MKLSIAFALSALLASLVAATGDWYMPESFSLNETQRFYWRIQPGTNILSMLVRPESNPNNGTYLPLGPCEVQDPGAKCSEYTNNGTAQFGGYYAGGLVAGQSYFISVNWITTDGSKNGTASSPSFVLEDPTQPQIPKITSADESSSSSTSEDSATQVMSTSTKTLHLSLITTISNSSTSNTALILIATPTQPVPTTPSPTPVAATKALRRGQIAGITIGSIAALSSIIFLMFYLFKRHQKRKNAEKERDASQLRNLSKANIPQIIVEKQELDSTETTGHGNELTVTEQEKERINYGSRPVDRTPSTRSIARYPPSNMAYYIQTARERHAAGLSPTFELEGGIIYPYKSYVPPTPDSEAAHQHPPEVYEPARNQNEDQTEEFETARPHSQTKKHAPNRRSFICEAKD